MLIALVSVLSEPLGNALLFLALLALGWFAYSICARRQQLAGSGSAPLPTTAEALRVPVV